MEFFYGKATELLDPNAFGILVFLYDYFSVVNSFRTGIAV